MTRPPIPARILVKALAARKDEGEFDDDTNASAYVNRPHWQMGSFAEAHFGDQLERALGDDRRITMRQFIDRLNIQAESEPFEKSVYDEWFEGK